MKTTLRLLILINIAYMAGFPAFGQTEKVPKQTLKSRFLSSSFFPVVELGYINQTVDSDVRSNKTGYSTGFGVGLRNVIDQHILSTALLFYYHDLSGTREMEESLQNIGSLLYLGYARRFQVKNYIFEDGFSLRTRFGEGAAYTYRGRDNLEVVTAIGLEFKYISAIKEKEVRYVLGGYYDLFVEDQRVWTILLKAEGYYDFKTWFK